MLRFRVASLLRMSLTEVDAMPAREFNEWARYWEEEPWGPYRDNLHAAMLCVETLRPHLSKGARVPEIENFMLRKANKKSGFGEFVSMLNRRARAPKKAAARKVPK